MSDLIHPLTWDREPLSNEELVSRGRRSLLNNVTRIPLAFVKGEGAYLYDADGRRYLDFLAGIATCAFGHAPPFMAELLRRQAAKLVHVSNLFFNEPMVLLAELLTERSGLDRAFFSNSGAEANEAAFKMARKHGFDRDGEKRVRVVSALNSFHGRTMGAISLTGQEKLHKGFHPLVPGISFVPYGDLGVLEKTVDDTVAGVILEPILGEGGIELPPEGYLSKVKKLCSERGALLILDEVQTGLGRTGKDFAFRHFDCLPDILTLGKGLGSGYPVAATLASEEAARALSPGSHSTTVGGAPLAMAVALELATRLLNPAFIKEVEEKGRYFKEGLEGLAREYPSVVSGVSGLGLLLGMKLKSESAPYTEKLREKGFLVNATAVSVLRFAPPLIINKDEIDLLLRALGEVFGTK
ncbi:MAG: acetylornithine/succinylornithine family transaminase [Deltaproteobacteria bacterium]|jgi:predicted acetylornithine/succinylornithine family transaminase|nr:acetylornithine/succinylornithine family transaminase [Deltaproteobacteria bacterium]